MLRRLFHVLLVCCAVFNGVGPTMASTALNVAASESHAASSERSAHCMEEDALPQFASIGHDDTQPCEANCCDAGKACNHPCLHHAQAMTLSVSIALPERSADDIVILRAEATASPPRDKALRPPIG